jgi:Ca2+-transporting ATPase
MEEPEADIMEKPPRDPNAPIFSSGDFKQMALQGGVISASSLGAYAYAISRYGIGPQASTVAFQSLVFGQLLYALSYRSEEHSMFDKESQPPNHNMVIGGSLLAQLMTIVFPPLRTFIGAAPIGLLDVGVIAAGAILPVVVNEASKAARRKTAAAQIEAPVQKVSLPTEHAAAGLLKDTEAGFPEVLEPYSQMAITIA